MICGQKASIRLGFDLRFVRDILFVGNAILFVGSENAILLVGCGFTSSKSLVDVLHVAWSDRVRSINRFSLLHIFDAAALQELDMSSAN